MCAGTFIYSNLLEKYPDDIFLKIRFYVPLDDENDPRTISANNLLALNQLLGDNVEMKQVLHHWYNEKEFNKASRDLLKHTNLIEFMPAIKIHKEWCLTNKINLTPTLLINGHLFSDHYQFADIENFIEILLEQEVSNQSTAYKSSYIYDN